MSTFSDRAKQALIESGLSRPEFVKRTGMTRGNAAHWFNGRATKASGGLVAKAAAVLNVNASWLASNDGPMKPTRTNGQHQPPTAAQMPPSLEEQEMQEEVKVRLLIQAWKALPEVERDEVLRQVNVRSMKHRSHIPDAKLTNLAAPGTEPAKRATKKKSTAGTQ